MTAPNKALFLDRDGVICRDDGYVYLPEQIVFEPGLFELLNAAKEQGYYLLVVTNQSGIGRGYYSEDQFLQLTEWINQQCKRHGAGIDHTYYCPHHPTEALGEYRRCCDCRKPAPGMLLQAIKEWRLDPAQCIMIGDSPTDAMAAEAAELHTFIAYKPKVDIPMSANLKTIQSLEEMRKYL